MERDELNFIEDVEMRNFHVKDREIKLTESDLPIYINYENRKDYVLKSTESGGLILNRKD